MKVYQDLFTGDELISDSYAQLAPFGDEGLLDVAFEVKSKKIAKGEENFGIAHNLDEDAEGDAAEGGDTAVETVVDVVDKFKYSSTSYTKADFLNYIKQYSVRVKEHLSKTHPDRVSKFQDGMKALAPKLVAKISDADFYFAESMDGEAQLIYSYYNEEEEAPRFIYIRDGLKEVRY